VKLEDGLSFGLGEVPDARFKSRERAGWHPFQSGGVELFSHPHLECPLQDGDVLGDRVVMTGYPVVVGQL
jgi:hypothetical protein